MNEMNQMNQETLNDFYKLVEDYSKDMHKADTGSIICNVVSIDLRKYQAEVANEFLQVLRAIGVSHNYTKDDVIYLFPKVEGTNAVIAKNEGESVRFLPFPLSRGNKHKYVVIAPNKDIGTASTFAASAVVIIPTRTDKSIIISRSVESEMVFFVDLS